jgi:hypothetical protein
MQFSPMLCDLDSEPATDNAVLGLRSPHNELS